MKTIKTYKMNRNLRVMIGFLMAVLFTSTQFTIFAQSDTTCERIVSNTPSCDGKNDYVVYLYGPIVGGRHFSNESLTWTELSNDAVKVEGHIYNRKSGRLYVNVTLSGRSTNQTPKAHSCLSNSGNSMDYYSNWNGYIQYGYFKYNVTKRGEDFQVGLNANTNNRKNGFGGSGWFDITNSSFFTRGDFNLVLTNNCEEPPADDCQNVELAKWDMNGCNPSGPAGYEKCYTNDPTIISNGGCTSISATAPCNRRRDFSCREGKEGEAVCFNLRKGSVSFDVTVSPSQGNRGKLSELSLYTASGDYSGSFVLSVYKAGKKVYESNHRSIVKNLFRLTEFDFSRDPDFTVERETTFTFVFSGYRILEMDEMVIRGGCCGDVVVCDISSETGPDQTICKGESALIGSDGVIPGATYKWSTDQSASQLSVSPSQTTTYSLTVTKGDCSDVDDVTINVESVLADAGGDKKICKGESVVLGSDGVIPGATYLWSNNESTSLIRVSPSTSTSYTLTVTKNGCEDISSVNVQVEECKQCDVIVGQPLSLSSTGGQTKPTYTTKYLLINSAGRISDIKDTPEFIPTTAGNYNVYAVNYSNSQNIDLSIGDDLSDIDQECFDISNAVPCVVCDHDGSPDCKDAYSDDFEYSMGLWNDGGSDCYRLRKSEYSESGKYSIRLRDNTSGSDMYTDKLDMSPYLSAEVSFSYLPISFDNSNENFMLEVSNDGGRTYQVVKNWIYGQDFKNEIRGYANETISGSLMSDQTRFRIRCDASSNGDIVYIDNVVIKTCIGSSTSNPEEEDVPQDEDCIASDIDEEDFERNLGIWYDGGVDCYRTYSNTYASSGRYSLRLRDNTTQSTLYSKILDMSSLTSLNVSFDYTTVGFDGKDEDFMVEVSFDGGTTFTTVQSFAHGFDFKNYEKKSADVHIPSSFLSANTVVRLRCDASSNNDKVYFDNLKLTSCSDSNFSDKNLVTTARSQDENDNLEFSYDFDIVPNPASTVAKLDLEEVLSKNVEIKIFNAIGEYVSGVTIDKVAKRFYSLELDDYADGMYIIKIKVDDNQMMFRKLNVTK